VRTSPARRLPTRGAPAKGARAAPASVAFLLLAALAVAALLPGCAGRRPADGGRGWSQRGIASWYGPGFHGRTTANGETYDMNALTAAHKELPFDTVVEVTNLDNGRRVEVRINDRGPFIRGRVIDLSRAGAEAIGMIATGTARVQLRARLGASAAGAAVGRAGFTVQVGSFRDRDRALDLAARLRRDFEVDVVAWDGWHRVRVGGLRSREAARRLAAELRRRGLEAYAVGVG